MEWNETLFLIGRLLLGGYFLLAAFGHFRNVRMMAGYATSKGVPAATVAVVGTGLLLAVGGLSVLLGVYPLVGLAALALFLAGVTPMMHAFWKLEDPMARMGEMVNFQKNVALLGAVLMLTVLGSTWPVSL